jgi:hypothetical protein
MTKLPDQFAPEDNSGQTQLNTDLDRRAGGSGIHGVQMQGILTAAPALFMIVLSAGRPMAWNRRTRAGYA